MEKHSTSTDVPSNPILTEEKLLLRRLKALLAVEPPAADSLDSRVTVYDLLSWSGYTFDLKWIFFWQKDNRFSLDTIRSSEENFMPSFRRPHPELTHVPQLVRPQPFTEKLPFSYYLREGRPVESYVTLLTSLAERGHCWKCDSDLAREMNFWLHRFALHSLDSPLVVSACCMLQKLLYLDRRLLTCHLRVVHCLENWCLHGMPLQSLSVTTDANVPPPAVEDVRDLLRRLLLDCVVKKSKRNVRKIATQLLEQMEKSLLWKLESDKLKDVEYVVEDLYLMTEFADLHDISRLPDGILHFYARENDWLTFLCLAEAFAFDTDQVKEAIQEFSSSSLRDHLSYVVSKAELTPTFHISAVKEVATNGSKSGTAAPPPVLAASNSMSATITSDAKTHRTQLLQKVMGVSSATSKKANFSESRPAAVEPINQTLLSSSVQESSRPRVLELPASGTAPQPPQNAPPAPPEPAPPSITSDLEDRQLSLSRLRHFAPPDLSSLLFDCTEMLQSSADISTLPGDASMSRQNLYLLWPRLLSYSVALQHPLLTVVANCCGCELVDTTSLRSIRVSAKPHSNDATQRQMPEPSLLFHKTLVEICVFIVASLPQTEYDSIVNTWSDFAKLSWTKEESVQLMADLVSKGICAPIEEAFTIFLPYSPLGSLFAVLRHAVEAWNPIFREDFKKNFVVQCKTFFSDSDERNNELVVSWIQSVYESCILSALCYVLKERGPPLCLLFIREWIQLTETNIHTRRMLNLSVVKLPLIRDILTILIRYVSTDSLHMITSECLGLAPSSSRCEVDPHKSLSTLLLSLLSSGKLCASVPYHGTLGEETSITRQPKPSPRALKQLLRDLKDTLPSLAKFEFPPVAYDLPTLSPEAVSTFVNMCLPPGTFSDSTRKGSNHLTTCNWRDSISISAQLVNTSLCNPYDMKECDAADIRKASIEESDTIELLLKEGRFMEAHEYAHSRKITHQDLYLYKLILLLVCNYQSPHELSSNVQQMIQSTRKGFPNTPATNQQQPPQSNRALNFQSQRRSSRDSGSPLSVNVYASSQSEDFHSSVTRELFLTVDSLLLLLKHGKHYGESCLRLLYVAWRLKKNYKELVMSPEMEVVCDIMSTTSSSAAATSVSVGGGGESSGSTGVADDRLNILQDYLSAVTLPEEELLPCLLDVSLLVLVEECGMEPKSSIYPCQFANWSSLPFGIGVSVPATSTSATASPLTVGGTIMRRQQSSTGHITPEDDIPSISSPRRNLPTAIPPSVMASVNLHRRGSHPRPAAAVPLMKDGSDGGSTASSGPAAGGGIVFRSISPNNLVRVRSAKSRRATSEVGFVDTSQRHRNRVVLLARCCYNRLTRSAPQVAYEALMVSGVYKNVPLSQLVHILCGTSATGAATSATATNRYQVLRASLLSLSTPLAANRNRERCIRLLTSTGQQLLREVQRTFASGRLSFCAAVMPIHSSSGEAYSVTEEEGSGAVAGGLLANYESEYLVELIILAHSCFQRIDNAEGISHCLKVSRQMANTLSHLKRFNQLVRLLRGLRHYNEMTYVFDMLVQAEEFELLLGRSEDKENTIVSALLQYLQRYHPQNTDLLRLVCCKHNLLYELAGVYQRKAHSVKHRIKEVMKNNYTAGGDKLKELQSLCIEAAQHLVQAALHYENDSFLVLARTCYREAQVYLVQIRWLQNPASLIQSTSSSSATTATVATSPVVGVPGLQGTGLPYGVHVLDLRRADAVLWLRHNTSFYEAYIWAASDRIQSSAVFPLLLWEHFLLRGDAAYLQTYLHYHSKIVTSQVMEECVAIYERNKPQSGKTQQHLQELFKYCNDQMLVEKLKRRFAVSSASV